MVNIEQLRITPEEIIAAYEATGLTPKQGSYFNVDNCACAIGALVFHLSGNRFMSPFVFDFTAKYGNDYFYGFMRGFDEKVNIYHDEEGYDDGKAAWEAVKAKFLTKKENE